MAVKVLMVGPQPLGGMGGISSLAQTIIPVLEQRVDLKYLTTVQHRAPKEAGKLSLRNVGLVIPQYLRFLQLLVQFRPDVVHIHTSQGFGWLKDSLFVVAAKLCGRRVVLHVHAADFDALYGRQPRLIQKHTCRVMAMVDAILAVSTKWQELLARIVPLGRILTFRNCVAVNAIAPRAVDPSSHRVKALFLGAVGPRKGILDLLDAMHSLKSEGCPLDLWIAGSEEKEGDFASASARLKRLELTDTCQLLGFVRGEQKRMLLQTADLFVLPSYNEGLPIALLEAMAAGLPVVATPVGGIPEVITDGHNGFLVAAGDVQALADKLAILTHDAQLRDVMGRRNREIAETGLDVVPYVERLVALYESLRVV